MTPADRPYLPAAGRHWQLPFYDLLAKLLGADAARRVLVEQVAPSSGERVLDVGSGTGSLAIDLKRAYPRADVVALDPDPRALAMARHKAERAAVAVQFDRGFADALPYPDQTFARVTSSFMYHHLPPADRKHALQEIRRVLQPGGRFHMLDFDGPEAGHTGFLARRVHANRHLRENAPSQVLGLMVAAGLHEPRVVDRRLIRIASMVYYEAVRL